MKEKPILFSGPMVRAILDWRKTQTRRRLKPQPVWVGDPGVPFRTSDADPNGIIPCPYGQPGDRLWVRETWGLMSYHDVTDWDAGSIRGVSEAEIRERYLVEHAANWNLPNESAHLRPSIHMPRWASRITLEITGVRVERLQEISDRDCIAEGVERRTEEDTPFRAYRAIWESIHPNEIPELDQDGNKIGMMPNPARWDANPYVWVIEFRRVEE